MQGAKVILTDEHLDITIHRLCRQLIENHNDFSQSALVALQPRGVILGQRILKELSNITGNSKIDFGGLDVTFYRDDFRRREDPIVPQEMTIDFTVEEKKVVLVDDVIYTGRHIRAGLDALLSFGRPSQVELLCLINRRLHRQLPIQPDYVGKTVDSVAAERVKAYWKELDGENKVVLYKEEA